MRNTVHRHEPPVSGKPLEVLVDDGEVVVVDKPASLPVHPCGRYRHNTVIFILGKEKGLSGLHTVHRLDRLTSGVLLFARTLEVSKKLDAMVRERQVRPTLWMTHIWCTVLKILHSVSHSLQLLKSGYSGSVRAMLTHRLMENSVSLKKKNHLFI